MQQNGLNRIGFEGRHENHGVVGWIFRGSFRFEKSVGISVIAHFFAEIEKRGEINKQKVR
jgi:hypothetical protein